MVKPNVLVVIPARGGSKTLPRKNIQLLKGSPLIAYSIAAGFQAKKVDRVIVSTDDDEIASVAKKYGVEVPFMRPSDLGGDDTLDLPVFQHALEWLLRHEKYVPDIVVQLRPTSPFRPPDLVDQAIEMLLTHKTADSVRGVVSAGQNPYKMWRIRGKNQAMIPLFKIAAVKEPFNAPRQLLPSVYWQTGHIDVIRTQTILSGSMSGKKIFPFIIDQRYAADIDSFEHLQYAEWLLDQLKAPIIRPRGLNDYGK